MKESGVSLFNAIMRYDARRGAAVNLVEPGPPGIVEVLKPSCRMTESKSAFCSGFASDAAKRLLVSLGSTPL